MSKRISAKHRSVVRHQHRVRMTEILTRLLVHNNLPMLFVRNVNCGMEMAIGWVRFQSIGIVSPRTEKSCIRNVPSKEQNPTRVSSPPNRKCFTAAPSTMITTRVPLRTISKLNGTPGVTQSEEKAIC